MANKIQSPAVSTKIGVVIGKIFGKNALKQHKVDGKATYFYHGFEFLPDDTREKLPPRVNLPSYVTMHAEHEMFVLYYPTTLFIDNIMCEFTVFLSTTTGQYWMHYRNTELKTRKLGLSSYTELDQVFIDGITRIINSFTLCRGREAEVPPSDKASKAIFPHVVHELGPNGNIYDRKNVWISKNCKGVMAFTAERKNSTCNKCVHDVNDRIRILKGKLSSSAEADDSGDEDEDDHKVGAGIGGSRRVKGSASESEEEDSKETIDGENVSIFCIYSYDLLLC